MTATDPKFTFRKGERWTEDTEYEWKVFQGDTRIGDIYWTAGHHDGWDVIDLDGKVIGQRKIRQQAGELLLEAATAALPAPAGSARRPRRQPLRMLLTVRREP
jgi:hypothetical protein